MSLDKMGIDADLIIPQLYIGRWPCENEIIRSDFDSIIYCAKECPPRVQYPNQYFFGINDTLNFTREEKQIVDIASNFIITLLEKNQKILVTCAQGINRSALVISITLLKLGMAADEIINLIREKRDTKYLMVPFGTKALTNPVFVNYIHLVYRLINK